jgi:EAL domain-containing protein (putative c-di-GMP-specific phosphodiesterase class I)
MSLIRQILWLLASVTALALLGGVSLNLVATRETLQTQLRLKNADNAASLALALSQHKGEPTTMGLLVSAQFDTGHYRRILLSDPAGQVLVERIGPPPAGAAPGWFVAALPIVSTPGLAQVSDGWKPIGRLEVVSHTAYAHDALWAGAVRAAGWLALVGALAALAAWAGVRALRRPLGAMVDQAAALQDGRFVKLPEPRAPELRALTRAMNSLVDRLKQVFEAQARQVEDLRRQAERDAGTGLAVRRQFVAHLDEAMGRAGDTSGGLVLVRLLDLDDLNRRVGRLVADHALRTVAQALAEMAARTSGALAGRLNGADFVLHLPTAGAAAPCGPELATALRTALADTPGAPAVCIGTTDLVGLHQAGDALSAVDDALARAEAQGPFGVAHRPPEPGGAAPRSQEQWRQLIEAALADERSHLAARAVLGRDGRVLQLDCPLSLRLDDADDMQAGEGWLSHALRSRLGARVDMRALGLALTQVAAGDLRLRSIPMAVESLATPGFVAEVRARLIGAGAEAARAIRLELPERALREHPDWLADAARQWRESGAAVGLAHAGGSLSDLAASYELGLAFVKVDRRHVQGLAGDPAVRQFASGLVTLLRGLGVQALAEGVDDAADLAAIWEIGFDGASGPAVEGR